MFTFCVKRAVSFADTWSNQSKFCCTEILFRVCLVDWGLRGNAYKSCFPRVSQNFTIRVEIAWRTPWGFAIGLSVLQVFTLRMCMTGISPWSYLEDHQNLEGLASQGMLRYKELCHLEWKRKKKWHSYNW